MHVDSRSSRQREATRYRPLQVFLPGVRCGFFDHSRDLFRPGDVDRVAGAGDFDLVTVGSCGIPAFEVWVDGPVFCRYQHPARLAFPCSCSDDCYEIVSEVEHLRSPHESALLGGQAGGEVLMKLRGVEVWETGCRLLYRTRLAEVAWEALSVVSLILSSIWHVGRVVHQTDNRWIRPGFRNYGSPIAVSDKNARSILLSKDALRGSYIFFKGGLRFLDDADVEATLDQNVVNAFPARTIRPGAVYQNNIPNAMLFVLR